MNNIVWARQQTWRKIVGGYENVVTGKTEQAEWIEGSPDYNTIVYNGKLIENNNGVSWATTTFLIIVAFLAGLGTVLVST